jgi:hypothetical protein
MLRPSSPPGIESSDPESIGIGREHEYQTDSPYGIPRDSFLVTRLTPYVENGNLDLRIIAEQDEPLAWNPDPGTPIILHHALSSNLYQEWQEHQNNSKSIISESKMKSLDMGGQPDNMRLRTTDTVAGRFREMVRRLNEENHGSLCLEELDCSPSGFTN